MTWKKKQANWKIESPRLSSSAKSTWATTIQGSNLFRTWPRRRTSPTILKGRICQITARDLDAPLQCLGMEIDSLKEDEEWVEKRWWSVGLMEEHGSRNVDEKKPNENNGRDKTKVWEVELFRKNPLYFPLFLICCINSSLSSLKTTQNSAKKSSFFVSVPSLFVSLVFFQHFSLFSIITFSLFTFSFHPFVHPFLLFSPFSFLSFLHSFFFLHLMFPQLLFFIAVFVYLLFVLPHYSSLLFMISFFFWYFFFTFFFFIIFVSVFFLPKKFKNFCGQFFEMKFCLCFLNPPFFGVSSLVFSLLASSSFLVCSIFYWFLMFNLLAVSLLISHVFFLFFSSLFLFPCFLSFCLPLAMFVYSLSCASSENFSKKKITFIFFFEKKSLFICSSLFCKTAL